VPIRGNPYGRELEKETTGKDTRDGKI